MTLVSESVVKAIESFVSFSHRYADRQIELLFVTTSEIGTERAIIERPAGMAALQYWRSLSGRASSEEIEPLRAILQSDRFPESVRRFCTERGNEALHRDLIQRIKWECGKRDLSWIREELEVGLVALGRNQFHLPAPEARRLADHLIYEVLKRSVEETPSNRVLSRADLYSAIDAETQLAAPEHSARSGYYSSPDRFVWGGVEEFVIAKGSDWCAELARVFCALCEMIGVPARIVFALDGSDDGHVLAECHGRRQWMLVDPLAAKLYQNASIGTVGAARMYVLADEEKRILTASAEHYYVHARFLSAPVGRRVLDFRRGPVRLRTEPLQRVLSTATVRQLERYGGSRVTVTGRCPGRRGRPRGGRSARGRGSTRRSSCPPGSRTRSTTDRRRARRRCPP